MALPHLLKYIYTHGTDEVVRRGKKIHAVGFVDLVEHDELFGSAVFRVKDDSYSTYYKVHIQQYKDAKTLSVRCACPYNLGDISRHEVAALIRLQEMMDKGMLQTDDVVYDQRHTVAKMKTIDTKTLRMLSAPSVFSEAENYLRTQKPVIESAKEETVKATVTLNGETVLGGQEIPGITGGALDSDEGTPGPLMLQGDHGKVWFRNITLTPAK